MLLPRAVFIALMTLLLCQPAPGAPVPARAAEVLPAGAVARLGTLRWRHDGAATGLAYSHDGRILAGSCAGRIILWESATGKRIRQLPTAAGWLSRHCLDFSADGRLLASAAGSPQPTCDVPHTPRIRLWDVKTGKEVGSFPGDGGFVASLAFSPDGNRLLSGMWNGSILVWDVARLARGPKS